MDKLIPVKDMNGLYRGAHGVIHNVDNEGYAAYIAHRNTILSDKDRIQKLETDVSEIKESLSFIVKFLKGVKDEKDKDA